MPDNAPPSRRLSGDLLRAHRQAAYLSRTELAFRIGKSADTVRAYEAGNVTPPSDVLAALVDALGCSFDDLHVTTIRGVASA